MVSHLVAQKGRHLAAHSVAEKVALMEFLTVDQTACSMESHLALMTAAHLVGRWAE